MTTMLPPPTDIWGAKGRWGRPVRLDGVCRYQPVAGNESAVGLRKNRPVGIVVSQLRAQLFNAF